MSPAYRPEAERFWEKVTEGENGCWLWSGALDRGGYGSFGVHRGPVVRAHRWAYESMVGEIPWGLQLDHLCRTRNCVNPYHCDPATNRVNARRGKSLKSECVNGHSLADVEPRLKQGRMVKVCMPCQRDRQAAYRSRNRQECSA